MRKTIFGGVAVAGALALFSGTAVAASNATTGQSLSGGQQDVETATLSESENGDDILTTIDRDLIEIEAQAENEPAEMENEPADLEVGVEAPENEVEDAAPALKVAEPEREVETEDAAKAPEVEATPEPAESPEQHEGGDTSDSH